MTFAARCPIGRETETSVRMAETVEKMRLFEWLVPCTFFIMVSALLPLKNRYATLLLVMLPVYTAVDMSNHFHYFIFGPRFLYETAPALLILTAAAMLRLPLLVRYWKWSSARHTVLQGWMAALVITITITSWPYTMPALLKNYKNYFHSHPGYYQKMVAQSQKPALIFVEAPLPKSKRDKYLWVAWSNPPRNDADIIFAHDLGDEKNRQLIEYYPDRIPYVEYRGMLYPVNRATYERPPIGNMPSRLPDAEAWRYQP